MAEKKEFFIPDHVDAKFELIKNVKPRELLIMVPSVLLTVGIFKFTGLSVPVKLAISILLIGVPGVSLVVRPIQGKTNISLQNVAGEFFRFLSRQREFLYHKEGDFDHVELIEEENGAKASTEGENDSAKTDSRKSYTARFNLNRKKSVG